MKNLSKVLLCSWTLMNMALACASYDPNNPFEKIVQGQSDTSIFLDSSHALSFKDIREKVKTHYLVIPKGSYVSFSDFSGKASKEEIVDLFRLIPKVAQKANISSTGYRIISNHACHPGANKKNDAYQEIPHLHIHITGGECLGMPVVGLKKETISLEENAGKDRFKADNSITENHHPFGYGMSFTDLVDYARSHKIKETSFKNKTGLLTQIWVFRVENQDNIPDYYGFILLDVHNRLLFSSFDEFAKKADDDEIYHLVKEINTVLKTTSLEQTGYRLFSNSGYDSWNFPERFQLYIAGGTILGPTITNVDGNKQTDPSAEKKDFYYFSDLSREKHDHCPSVIPKLTK